MLALTCKPLQQTIATGKPGSNSLFVTALQADGARVALQLDVSTSPAAIKKLSNGFLKDVIPILDAASAYDYDRQVQWFESSKKQATGDMSCML